MPEKKVYSLKKDKSIMKKHFTLQFIGQKYNRLTNHWVNEYLILRDGKSYTHCGLFVVGYREALKECKRLEHRHYGKDVQS